MNREDTIARLAEEGGHLLLRRAAAREDDIADAIWSLVYPDGTDVTYRTVLVVNADIAASDLTVQQWIDKGCPTCLEKP